MILNHAIVICSKQRPSELISLLNNLSRFQDQIYQIIVICSGYDEKLLDNFKSKFQMVTFLQASSGLSNSRNLGISSVSENTDWIHFLDDDILISEDYFIQCNLFLINKENIFGVTGYDENFRQFKGYKIEVLKYIFRLFPNLQGRILKSGFNLGVYLPVPDKKIDWLPGCNMILNYKLSNNFKFNEIRDNTALAEDFDFFLKYKNTGNLLFHKEIKYFHFHSPINRMSKQQRRLQSIKHLTYLLKDYPESFNHYIILSRIIVTKFLYFVSSVLRLN